jgi:amphi-Trp domain-containing protein
MSKDKFKAEGTASTDKLVHIFEGLLESIKSGKLMAEYQDHHVEFDLGGAAEVEIEAKVKNGKKKFSIEMEWKDDLVSHDDIDVRFAAHDSTTNEKHELNPAMVAKDSDMEHDELVSRMSEQLSDSMEHDDESGESSVAGSKDQSDSAVMSPDHMFNSPTDEVEKLHVTGDSSSPAVTPLEHRFDDQDDDLKHHGIQPESAFSEYGHATERSAGIEVGETQSSN